MTFWRVIVLAFTTLIFVEAKYYQHHKRDTSTNICDPSYNSTTYVQCYCVFDPRDRAIVRHAECHLTKKDVSPDDKCWASFSTIKNATKLTLSNTRGIHLKYVPTNALLYMQVLMELNIKYGNIENIDSFAFGNLTLLEEISLSDNQIKTLSVNAFAHHRDLTSIALDTNNLQEINRNVFVDLPSLEKLFLTNNQITTIHDKAFVHLLNLRELEIDRNNLFSLNSETFSGLKKLRKLDLSGNSLEVIGDNTFLPLTNLESLNLDGNRIQMLDEKAFYGLGNLQVLSLVHNNLTKIDNPKTFESLHSLSVLSLKSNKLIELRAEILAPILNNFYSNTSNLDVEDNNFPCDCHLDWFMTLINKTQNINLKIAIENLKCNPSDTLRNLWVAFAESEKNTDQAFEDDASQIQNPDIEYYEEGPLNGKFFYMDIRDLANCTNNTDNLQLMAKAMKKETITSSTTSGIVTKATISSQTSPKPVSTTEYIEITSKDVPVSSSLYPIEAQESTNKPNKDNETKMKEAFTTSRLATVSAKPLNHDANLFDKEMASDEARPEGAKAHRSVQEKDTPKYNANSAQPNISRMVVVIIMLTLRLCF
ncbi:unnamed protein product [Arctia plantaginis]|uniref:Connectin n=1 Tax=Arctia plantaginis TaxID=874455 RepID=A0A8S1BAS4_ARCPL|nr:unnamed protein product [Arctia plantaginis]